MQQTDQKAGKTADSCNKPTDSCNKPTESRNKREGRYLGWRVTGGRNSLNWNCKQINHERTGTKDLWSLKGWAKQLKGGRP